METTNLDYSVNKLCISYAGISDDDGSQVYTDDEEDASINPTLKYSSIKAIPKETVTKKPESISDDDDSQLYTEDEEDTSINPTLKYSSIKPIPKETVIKKPESSESESKSSESEADDAEMKDPFKFGDKDPFKKSRSNEISCEQFITPCSTLPTIPITEAKQRILACCRDLQISEENEIRYPDLQKIYFKHFGTSLDKAELNLLFGVAAASEVLKKDFAKYLKVKLARECEDKIMKLTSIGDIRESLHAVENNEIFGILKPIPELSPQDVEDVLKNSRRFTQLSSATNLNHRISSRDFQELRKQGFAKENFFELPRVKNPVINEEEGSDEFTDDENELIPKTYVTLKPRRKFVIPADPDVSLRPSLRPRRPSNNVGSTTSSMANTNVTSMVYRRPNLPRPRRVPYEEDSDVWSDETEDFTPQLLYKEPYGEVYREKLNVTTQSFAALEGYSSDESFGFEGKY